MPRDSPNVVWVSLESVRADHTTVGGYDRDTTPNLRRIADMANGTLFSHCYAQSIWTPASTASILTGTYLFRHGVGLDEAEACVLSPELDTLPGLLTEKGYSTACISTNAFLSEATNLDSGFDDLLWLRKSKRGVLSRRSIGPFLGYLARLRSYGPGYTLDGKQHNLTYVLERLARRYVRRLAREEPFFLYVHPSNSHHPYAPPLSYRDRYFDEVAFSPEEAIDLSLEVYGSQEAVKRRIANGANLTDDEWDAIRALYDAEVAYVDDFVGRLFDLVSEVAGETIFVVTGDHGDLFGEQGVIGHNLVLHDGLIHVPLVIHGMADVDRNAGELVQHVDVTRTLAERLGCTSAQFQGIDLRSDSRDHAVSQRGRAEFDRYREYNPDFDGSRYHEAPLTALHTGEYKLLKSEERTELVVPPDEEADVGPDRPETLERLEAEMDALLSDIGGPVDEAEEPRFTREMRQQLSDLGYL